MHHPLANMPSLYAILILLTLTLPATATASAPSTGCQTREAALWKSGSSKSLKLSLNSPRGGGRRTFLLHLPDDYASDKPSPLILSFHGKDQDASAMETQTSLSDHEMNPDAVVAYPQGVDKMWTGDPEAPPTSQINDVDFVADLLDYLEQQYCIDTLRVYATGFSNGGGLTDLLACSKEVSARLAAVAIASGAFYKDSALQEPLFSACNPTHVMPIMEFHGEKDLVEHYDGKGTPDGESYALREWCAEWAERNGCTAGSENRTVELYAGEVLRSTWSCGKWEDVVVHYFIKGFGHGWPTTTHLENDYQRFGPTYFNATPMVMEFFGKYALLEGKDDGVRRDEL